MSKFFREQNLPISKLVSNQSKPDSPEIIEEIKVDYFESNSKPNSLELPPQKSTTAIVHSSKLDNSTNLLWSKLKEQESQLKQINARLKHQLTVQETQLHSLNREISFSQSQAELQQAQNDLCLTEIDVRLNELNRIIKIEHQLNSLYIKSAKERMKLIAELNWLKKKRNYNSYHLWLEQEKLDRKRLKLIQTFNQERKVREKMLLDLNLKHQKVLKENQLLVTQLAYNTDKLNFNQVQQQALNDYQIKKQAQRKIDSLGSKKYDQTIKAAQESLVFANHSFNETIEELKLSRQRLEQSKQLLDEVRKQVEIEAQLAANSQKVLELQQQTSDIQRKSTGEKSIEVKQNSLKKIDNNDLKQFET